MFAIAVLEADCLLQILVHFCGEAEMEAAVRIQAAFERIAVQVCDDLVVDRNANFGRALVVIAVAAAAAAARGFVVDALKRDGHEEIQISVGVCC